MKVQQILMSAPMVRAILARTKTQTRRVVKPQPRILAGELLCWKDDALTDDQMAVRCPYGQPGDRLWVRETFRGCRAYEVQGYAPKDWGNKPIWFEADGAPPGRPEQWALRSRPSIHMPRWASRITLEVTGVRVERLQDISEADAVAEGSFTWAGEQDTPVRDLPEARLVYRQLWEDINGPGSWDTNPWVWCVDFKRPEAA